MTKSLHYLFLLLFITGVYCADYSTSVYGRVVCNGRPVDNIRLRLYDKRLNRTTEYVRISVGDKQLYETDSNRNGEFRLFGSIDTLFKFAPYVRLYHKCNYSGFCSKTVIFNVPSDYITRDSIPVVTFDVGIINLNQPSQNQSLVCSLNI